MFAKKWSRLLVLSLGLGLAGLGCGTEEPNDESEGIAGVEGKADLYSTFIKVTTDKKQYATGGAIKINIENKFIWTAIYLDGCNSTVLQRFENSAWKDLPPQKMCLWEGFARKIAAGTYASGLDQLLAQQAGKYRVKVPFKTRCKTNQTFSQCDTQLKEVFSAEVTVGGGFCGGIAGIQCPAGEKCKLDGNYPDAGGKCVPETYCDVPADCKGLVHIMCVGQWQCVNNQCNYQCGVPQTECADLGGYCLPLTNPANQPDCKVDEIADTNLGCGGLAGQTTTCCLPKQACWGAWTDEFGGCRGPADGVLPDACCKEDKQQICAGINQKWSTEVQKAKVCNPFITVLQCVQKTTQSLIQCSANCPTYVNAISPAMTDLKKQWDQLKCNDLSWVCIAVLCLEPDGGFCDTNTSKCLDVQYN